ncbi:MAG TPA: PAS domain S-box protein [Methanofollis liminatans]|uniref:PAS domain S-box protein n=1 Tax=Methanofollis liminatans TaxID=2201 RepID=A0A831LFB7_9EURY|nr:PAS domain S-box protein [Methanofollis liminatans]
MGEERRELVAIRELLKKNPHGMSVTQIAEAIGMNRITVARYLDVMRASGQVEMEPYGQAKVFFLSRRIPVTAILDFFSDGVAALDKEGRIIDTNRKLREIAGCRDTDLSGAHIAVLLSSLDDEGRLGEVIRRAADGNEGFFESALSVQGEDRRFFRVRVVPTVFMDSSPGSILILEDITEWKRAEEQMVAQRDLAWTLSAAQTLFEAMPPCVDTALRLSGMDAGGAYVADPETGVFDLVHATGISQRFARSFSHISPSSPMGERIRSSTPYYAENLKKEDGGIGAGTWALRSYAVVPVLGGGQVIACFLVGSHIRNLIDPGSRKALETVAASIGNTIQRIRAQEGLRESEEKYRILFNNLDDAIFLHLIGNGLPGRIIEVNDTTCARLGYTREELLALTPLQINDPAYPGDLAEIMRRLLEEKHVFFEWAHLTKDGTRIPVEINAHLFTLKGEEVVIAIVRDLRLRGGA